VKERSLSKRAYMKTSNGAEKCAQSDDERVAWWKRFDEANMEALGSPSNPPPDTNAPPSKRRALPAPFDAPPYPNGEWQIGGTEIIGDQNLTPDYPLMQAIYDGPHGQAWRDSKIKFYGWEDFSGDISTSRNAALSTP
jgi:hypothetical protein